MARATKTAVVRMRRAPGPKDRLGMPGARIDIHHHIFPPKFTRANIERIVDDARGAPAEAYLNWSPQVSLEDMDANGVQSAIVSMTSPGVWFGNVRNSRRFMRDCNEFGARMAADHPGRFGMFAALALPDIEGSLREIEYALDVLKLDGIGLVTNYDTKLLGDPSFAPVFEELNRRKAKVFVHPTAQACCTDLNPWVRPPNYEFPFDTTRTITSLLFSGAFTRFANIKFIFCHGGGVLPMVLGRIGSVIERDIYTARQRKAWFPKGIKHEIAKSYYDIVAVTDPTAMAAVRSIVPVDHLLLGSDLPFRKMGPTLSELHARGFTAAELRAIERDNALRLFPRFGASKRKAA